MKTKLNKINFPRSRSLLTNFRLSYKYAMATILNYRDALIGTSIIIGALCILILSEDYVASSYATGSKNKQPHSHLTHSRIGSHGMVLITDGIKLYASHLPLYHKPHDYQLLYQISTKHQSEIINQLQQHKTITILPDKFDLNILVQGQLLLVKGQIFDGHFERGGTPWLEKADFRFEKLIYKRALSTLAVNTQQVMDFDRIQTEEVQSSIGKTKAIFIHKIGARPSFDLIIAGRQCKTGKTFSLPIFSSELLEKVDTAKLSTINQIAEINQAITFCRNTQVLYLETRDFK